MAFGGKDGIYNEHMVDDELQLGFSISIHPSTRPRKQSFSFLNGRRISIRLTLGICNRRYTGFVYEVLDSTLSGEVG